MIVVAAGLLDLGQDHLHRYAARALQMARRLPAILVRGAIPVSVMKFYAIFLVACRAIVPLNAVGARGIGTRQNERPLPEAFTNV